MGQRVPFNPSVGSYFCESICWKKIFDTLFLHCCIWKEACFCLQYLKNQLLKILVYWSATSVFFTQPLTYKKRYILRWNSQLKIPENVLFLSLSGFVFTSETRIAGRFNSVIVARGRH